MNTDADTTMNTNSHLSTDEMTDYLDNPEASDFCKLRLHLANCTECREKTMKMSSMKHNLQHILPRLLDTTESASDSNALKAELHLATHSAAMRRHLDNTSSESETTKPEANIKQTGKPGTFIKNLISWQTPVWASVTATAVVVFAVTLLLPPVTFIANNTDISVIAYQDDPFVTFRKSDQNIPGIGFFNEANQSRENFSTITLALKDGNNLHMKWSPVNKAKNYEISLFKLQNQNKVLVTKKATTNNEVIFNLPKIETGRRYEWTITGKTTENLVFQTKGGLIVSNGN